jgi:hypothetical protein
MTADTNAALRSLALGSFTGFMQNIMIRCLKELMLWDDSLSFDNIRL